MKLSAATILLAAPVVFGFAPKQAAFRSQWQLFAITEAKTEKKVRFCFVTIRSENLSGRARTSCTS